MLNTVKGFCFVCCLCLLGCHTPPIQVTALSAKAEKKAVHLEGDMATDFSAVDFRKPVKEAPDPTLEKLQDTLVYVSGPSESPFRVSLTGDRRPLATVSHAQHPILSPDTRQVVFSRHQIQPGWELFSIFRNGESLSRLGFHSSEPIPQDWSSQNQLLVLDQGALFRYDFQDKTSHALLAGLPFSSAAWSPDGSQMALVYQGKLVLSDRLGQTFQVKALERKITGKIGWAKDNSAFVYESNHQLYTTAITGGTSHWLADNASEPVWSPDSRHIAYVSDGSTQLLRLSSVQVTNQKAQKKQLFAIDIHTQEKIQLNTGEEDAYDPNW